MITITLTKEQARTLLGAVEEAMEACGHESNMVQPGLDYDWIADLDEYEALESELRKQIGGALAD